MSPEFMRRAQRVPASPDPDEATAQTVRIMCQHIAKSAQDPLVKACARSAVGQWRGGPVFASTGRDPSTDPRAIAESAWWWAKHQLKFVHHSKLILAWLNERDQLQLLIEPAVLVRMQTMLGDCAIYTMLICTLLDCFSVPWEIVTLAVDPQEPSVFSHVFPRVVLPSGRRMTLDASHGRYPGWQVPRERTCRSQVWDQAGNPIKDTPAFQGLHDYVATPQWGWRRPGLWGLGQDDGTDAATAAEDTSSIPVSGLDQLPATSIDTSSLTLPTLTSTQLSDISNFETENVGANTAVVADALAATPSLSAGSSYPSGSITVPSQSAAAWAAFANAATKAGMTLAEINALPAGSVMLPNGTIAIGAAGTSLASSLTSGSTSTILLYGGLGLLALLLISSKR